MSLGSLASPERWLDLASFFLADVRDGLGPYLSIYLLTEHSLSPTSIGLIMSVSGLASLTCQPLAGALVDRSNPRRIIALACAIVTVSCLSVPFVPYVQWHCLLQALSGAAAGVFAPALAALTLGLTGPGEGFSRRIGRNEMYNHAGNASAAMLSGILSAWNKRAVFWLMAFNCFCSLVAVCFVPSAKQQPQPPTDSKKEKAVAVGGGLGSLFGSRNQSLRVFALCLALFHLANAAMLPLVGQKLAAVYGVEHATMLTSSAIVGAQVVMAPVSRFVGSKTDAWGRRPLLLLGFAALPIRGCLSSLSDNMYYMLTVQLLDGLGVGIIDTLLPLVVRDVVGSGDASANASASAGSYGASLGSIALVQGIGAAASSSLAGCVVDYAGFDVAFLVLGAVAAVALLLLVVAMPETKSKRKTR